MKVKGKTVSARTAQRQAETYIRRIESKLRKKPGGAKLIKFIEGQILKSSKAPSNWGEAKAKARAEAGGIREVVKEKAKKSKVGAAFWFIVLIIVVPILILVFILLTRKVELPEEEQFTDEDFRP